MKTLSVLFRSKIVFLIFLAAILFAFFSCAALNSFIDSLKKSKNKEGVIINLVEDNTKLNDDYDGEFIIRVFTEEREQQFFRRIIKDRKVMTEWVLLEPGSYRFFISLKSEYGFAFYVTPLLEVEPEKMTKIFLKKKGNKITKENS